MNSLTQPNNSAVAVLQDQKASGTQGGTFTSGAWRTRDLNTEVSDPAGIVSLASNQFTLQAGRYFIEAEAPVNFASSHQARIQNITDGATALLGGNQYSGGGGVGNRATVTGVVTITSAKVFELQHRCSTTDATDGFGLAGSFGTEVYSQVVITRL